MGDFSKNLNNKFRMKNVKENAQKDLNKYAGQVYRPDAEVVLTGEEFMILRKMAQEVRSQRVIVVMGEAGQQIGYGLPEKDFDVDALFMHVDRLHRKNVDSGLTVPLETLKKEFEEAAKKEQASKPKQKVEPDFVPVQDEETYQEIDTSKEEATQAPPEVTEEPKEKKISIKQ